MSTTSHYNPDWLSDDALLANFVARQNEFTFLRDELSRAPLEGNVQHYLLVGVRGAGKTTLLKRLAVAIRRDTDLNAHLIALSFPEEMYQVKNLADFWWAACDALADELDFLKREAEADDLMAAITTARRNDDRNNPVSDVAFRLLQQTCVQLKLRPVMLVDNLDMVFQRIDKNGRKLNDPHAPAYWALRESLSTSTSPIVIAGSVRLSAPFKDYDKAFYDFFLPKRLGKLSLEEARLVLDRLSEAQRLPDLQERLRARPGRIEALFELTGGNPRALGLIFELLRSGPNSRAVEDFERLMDITTPYYKARIEDMSDQAQVIMHALAVHGIVAADGLRFGHTAAEIGGQSGLPTTTVSAQLAILENEGLVEKSADHGRTQYRIAEQMFRLWLQMRGTRRIRQNVIGLTKFFEAMYDTEELHSKLKEECGASALSEAKFAFAIAGVLAASSSQRRELESYGANRLRIHIEGHGGNIEEYLPSNEPSGGIFPVVDDDATKRKALECMVQGRDFGLNGDTHSAELAYRKAVELDPTSIHTWSSLASILADNPESYEEAESAYRKAIEIDPESAHSWEMLGLLLGNDMNRLVEAEDALRKAIELSPFEAGPWTSLGILCNHKLNRLDEAIAAYRKAISLDPSSALAWTTLGAILGEDINCHEEAEAALRNAIAIKPNFPLAWNSLAEFLEESHREGEALLAYEQANVLDKNRRSYWQLRHIKLRVRLCISAAQQAVDMGDHMALAEALRRLLADPPNIASALLDEQFIEGFLVPILDDLDAVSNVLVKMRQEGYEKHARPLLLALEAVIESRSDMLDELEPEVRDATRRMYERLIAGRAPAVFTP